MKLDDLLGPPLPLEAFITTPRILPEWAWLYADAADTIMLSTLCRPRLYSTRDISDEEADARDARLEDEGMMCLFSRSQIEDIIENLRGRYRSPTLEQIETAMQHYFEHDAFIGEL